MHSPKNNRLAQVTAQRGTTLIVVLVLILLATVMALFAVNVNKSEQRASGNDVRARLMRESAEAALTQGMAYMQSLKTTEKNPFDPNSYPKNGTWVQCNGGDTTFPCGTVPQNDGSTDCAAGTLPCLRRANMFYFQGASNDMTLDLNGDGQVDAIEQRMLPMKGRMTELTTVGNGFGVQYGAAALLCVLKIPAVGAANPPVECATNAAEASGTIAMTVVAVGSIPTEAGHITLTQSEGAYLRINNPIGAPPIVASGSADLTGGFQVVTNPNSAGTGVPISIWSRGPVSKTGTSNTCYYNEFINSGEGNGQATADLEPPVNYSGAPPVTPADQIMRCDQCQCPGTGSLSFSKSGNQGQLGIDILQCNSVPYNCTGTQLNDPTNPNSNYELKPSEFPCDLFQYVFGAKAHKDTDNDYFCETQITTTAKLADGANHTIGVDEAYLYDAADKIIPKDAAHAAFIKGTKLATCTDLNKASASGFWWDQTGQCTLTGTACLQVGTGGKGNNTSCVGSILFPLLLVGDEHISIQNATVFGFMFVRATGTGPSTTDPIAGLGNGTLVPASGGDGNSNYSMNAKSTLYGALVVQGTVTKVNGSAAVIYNDKVLKNLLNNALPPAYGSIPGGWSDRFSY